MLGRRYLQINNTPIPNPISFKIVNEEDETINISEAGTELVRVRRLNKKRFSGTWNLTSFWLKKFQEWCESNSVTLTYQGNSYTCRMRDFNPQLVEDSEYTETSEGLWKISPTITEI